MGNHMSDSGGEHHPDSANKTDWGQLIEDVSSHAIFRLNTDGDITTWSEPAQSLYGYEPDAVLRENVEILFANPDELETSVDALLSAATSGSVETQHWHRKADDSVFWATLSLSRAQSSEAGGFVAISQDTTEKHQYEQMLEQQNDRLKEFTDILAHDLRNPLSVISSRLHLARQTGDTEHLDSIEETTDRMSRLIEDLLSVARHGDAITDPGTTDIETVINTAWQGTGGTADQARLQYDPVCSVCADSDRLIQLFENLFQNVVQHAGDAATVRVGPLRHGFFIEDDGPGIPADVQDDVFDHGFTTDENGNGYGLSVVRTIAGAHGWDITVTASDTGGARFEITGVEFLD